MVLCGILDRATQIVIICKYTYIVNIQKKETREVDQNLLVIM